MSEHLSKKSNAESLSPFGDIYADGRFKQIADYFYPTEATEAPEPTFEKSIHSKGVMTDVGHRALELVSPVIVMDKASLEAKFTGTDADVMDKLTDEDILNEFFYPELYGEGPSPEASEVTRRQAMTVERSTDSYRGETPMISGSSGERVPDTEAEKRKFDLLDLFASELSGLSDERKYGLEADDTDRNLEELSIRLIDADMATKGESRDIKKLEQKLEHIVIANKLDADDLQRIIDKLPRDRKLMLPVYRTYIRLMHEADNDKSKDRQLIFDKANLFYNLASLLMVNKYPGWDDIYMDNLRRGLAVEHPELEL